MRVFYTIVVPKICHFLDRTVKIDLNGEKGNLKNKLSTEWFPLL